MPSLFNNRRVAFVGKLGGLTKKEAMQLVRDHDGIPVDRLVGEIDLIVLGADQLPSVDSQSLLGQDWQRKVDQGDVELIHETDLWERLGMVDPSQNNLQLYTPAMLADLLKVPIRNIRRWHRIGLIKPLRVIHRLAYFDFEEVRNARQIAGWLAGGASLASIKKQLQEFVEWNSDNERSIAQLNIIVEGRKLLLRKEEGLVEAGGQFRLDFDAVSNDEAYRVEPAVLSIDSHPSRTVGPIDDAFEMTQDELIEVAQMLEDEGKLGEAIEWYRVVLARFGPQADIHFQLAELLYREGEILAARERYYAAIELDEDFVEARANLGCVLVETGRLDLAIAAFRGALTRHDAYPDVHYHLARALDDASLPAEAEPHWERFIQLAPGSPWLEEAQVRLMKARK